MAVGVIDGKDVAVSVGGGIIVCVTVGRGVAVVSGVSVGVFIACTIVGVGVTDKGVKGSVAVSDAADNVTCKSGSGGVDTLSLVLTQLASVSVKVNKCRIQIHSIML